MYLVSSGFSFKPSSSTQFSQERVCRNVVVKNSIKSNGTADFTPFGEFMISPIHDIYFTEFVSLETMFTN